MQVGVIQQLMLWCSLSLKHADQGNNGYKEVAASMPVGSTDLNRADILRNDAVCRIQPDMDRVATREPWEKQPADMQRWETLRVCRPKACQHMNYSCHYLMRQDKHEVTCLTAQFHPCLHDLCPLHMSLFYNLLAILSSAAATCSTASADSIT